MEPVANVYLDYVPSPLQRSIGNFKISGERMPTALVHAFGIVKKAAAITNVALKDLDAGSQRTIALAEVVDALRASRGG
jgi:fumarate hydratase class II